MYKQVIIVRKDLNMSPGKLSAQVSHASMAFLSWMIRNNAHPEQEGYDVHFSLDKGLYEEWINGTFTKTVLQAKNKNQLLKAKTLAEELGMQEGKEFFLIKDNCYTELQPEEFGEDGIGRTLTCIGFCPMDAEMIDKVGKKFHLYV